tara:strand:+ start:288 stop:479 length:192 start_codon:yes stop_codon:yes gene_type:complete
MPILEDHLYPVFNAWVKIGQGVEAITLQDIKAYIDIYDDPLEWWEIDAILGLDKARLSEWQTK